MSYYSNYTYIGPAIKLNRGLNEIRIFLTCSNEKCKNWKMPNDFSDTDKFCHECGSKTQNREIERKVLPDMRNMLQGHDMLEEWTNLFVQPSRLSCMILIPVNMSNINFALLNGEEYVQMPSNLDESLEIFKSDPRVKALISALNEKYGEDFFNVVMSIVNYS